MNQTLTGKIIALLAAVAALCGALAGLLTATQVNTVTVPPNVVTACDPQAAIAALPNKPTGELENVCPQRGSSPLANQRVVVPPAAFKTPPPAVSASSFRSASTYANGRLPESVLCRIPGAGPQKLRCDAARGWNRMYGVAHLSGVTLAPCGGYCSYRPLFAQYATRASACRAGRCYMAAVPGTSRHGLAIAVDLGDGGRGAMRAWIDRHGAAFGWAKRCSDASWEPWHISFNPGCTGANPANLRPRPVGCHRNYVRVNGHCRYVVRPGHSRGHGAAVRSLQRNLKDHCLHVGKRSHYDHKTRVATRKLQRRGRIRPDAVVRAPTWRSVLRRGKCGR